MVKDAPTFRVIYPEILRIITQARVVIYNAEFDTGRLWYDCQRCDLPQLEKLFAKVECAMYQYAAWYGDWNDYYKSFRWQKLTGGHRALGDCLACLERIKTMAQPPAGAHPSGYSEASQAGEGRNDDYPKHH